MVKLVNRKEVEENDWSLTPGRFVGVTKEPVDEDFDFEETMEEMHDEIESLNEESIILSKIIIDNFESLEL